LESLINEGNVLYAQTKYDEAIACYDRILEVDPNYYFAWGNKGLALDNLAKYDEAIACYDRVLDLHPADFNAWHYKGNVLYAQTMTKPLHAMIKP
jgi:tetratricopeptide (TPR) repeat protein